MLGVAVFFGCHSINFLEVGVKHGFVVHAYAVNDFLNGDVGGQNQVGAIGIAAFLHEFTRSVGSVFFETSVECAYVDACQPGRDRQERVCSRLRGCR